MRKVAFAPIVDSASKILLLGTMPGEESLKKLQYYGHKQNQFWKILFTLYNEPLASDYEKQVAFLYEKRIALWDVLQSCEGKGSLDSNIKNEIPNDFKSFFAEYPQIKYVFFTSRKAESFYKKYVGFELDKIFQALPSPSPAYAAMKFDDKVDRWKLLLLDA